MAGCLDCNEGLVGDAAVCSSCAPAQVDGPQILEVDGPYWAGQTQEVLVEHRTRVAPLAFLLGLLVGFPLVWALTGNDVASDALPDERATIQVEEVIRLTTTTTVGPPTTPQRTRAIPAWEQITYPAEPVLGRQTGLSLFVGSLAGLREIDLDTGVITRLETQLQPSVLVDEHLVLVNVTSGGIYSSPLADLEERKSLSAGGWGSIQGFEDDVLWIRRIGSDGMEDRFEEVHLSTGAVGRRINASELDGSVAAQGSSPAILSPDTGGIFRLTDGGAYERVAEGTVVAHGYGLALVRLCDGSECFYDWLGTNDFQQVDLAVPEYGTLRSPRLTGGGRWLVYQNRDQLPELLELQSGVTVSKIGLDVESVAVSPAGDFAAVFLANTLVLIDLENDQRTIVSQVQGSHDGVGAVFAPSPPRSD